MALSPGDAELIANMKQREMHLKSMERATDSIIYRTGRYRALLIASGAALGAIAAGGLFIALTGGDEGQSTWVRRIVIDVILGAIIGALFVQWLLRTQWGRRLIERRESALVERYTSELHAGRRWRRFYYRDEDIAAYVPQILHFVEGEHRFDSVDEARRSPRRTAIEAIRSPRRRSNGSATSLKRPTCFSSRARTGTGRRRTVSCAL